MFTLVKSEEKHDTTYNLIKVVFTTIFFAAHSDYSVGSNCHIHNFRLSKGIATFMSQKTCRPNFSTYLPQPAPNFSKVLWVSNTFFCVLFKLLQNELNKIIYKTDECSRIQSVPSKTMTIYSNQMSGCETLCSALSVSIQTQRE